MFQHARYLNYWYHILIQEGSYDIEDINRVIQQKIKQNGHAANVTISANTNTLKAVLILENNYYVDFRPDHSICSLLGFNHAEYTSDYQESENPVNILSVNPIPHEQSNCGWKIFLTL